MTTTTSLLLVDDEQGITVPMARYFGRLGCKTDVAAEAEEAAALVTYRRYDLAILDLRLTSWGGREGLDIVAEIRRCNPGTVIVVLSALIDEHTEEEARRRGADAVLRKPQPLGGLARTAFALLGAVHE